MVRSTAERSTIVLWRGHCVRQKICRGALGPHDAPVELIPAVRPVAGAAKPHELDGHLGGSAFAAKDDECFGHIADAGLICLSVD